jgi:preprotein translocase subunit SecF
LKDFKVVPWIISTLLTLLIILITSYNALVTRTFEKGIDCNKKEIAVCKDENKEQDKEIAELDKEIAIVDNKLINHIEQQKQQDKKKVQNGD